MQDEQFNKTKSVCTVKENQVERSRNHNDTIFENTRITTMKANYLRYTTQLLIGPVSGSRYMARLRAIGAYWGLSETIGDWTQE